VHVRVDDDGKTHIEHVVEADKVREVLDYVEYDRGDLVGRVQTAISIAEERGDLTPEESEQLLQRYEAALEETTYLSRD
jgi:arginine decarboxylase-like protein